MLIDVIAPVKPMNDAFGQENAGVCTPSTRLWIEGGLQWPLTVLLLSLERVLFAPPHPAAMRMQPTRLMHAWKIDV